MSKQKRTIATVVRKIRFTAFPSHAQHNKQATEIARNHSAISAISRNAWSLAGANRLTTASAIIHVFGFTICNNAAARAVNRTWRLEERFAAGALNSCQLIQESHSTPAQLIT